MTIDSLDLRPSRRRLLAGGAGLAAALAAAGAVSAETPAEEPDFLFVQTAKGMTYDAAAKRLTLTGVSPVTLFFSDRPERIAGNMRTAHFEDFWKGGKDSFLQDPPMPTSRSSRTASCARPWSSCATRSSRARTCTTRSRSSTATCRPWGPRPRSSSTSSGCR